MALAADERLEEARLDFPVALADYLTTIAIGLHARADGTGQRRRRARTPLGPNCR